MSQVALDFRNEIEPKKGVKIGFGIHSDCTLTGIEVKQGEYVDINFAKDDKYHNKRLWYPNGKYPQKVKLEDGSEVDETESQAKNREAKARAKHLGKIADIFLGKEKTDAIVEKLIPTAESWADKYDDFCKVVADAVNKVASTKRVNLKLIYDSEGVYSVFGNFPDYVEEHVASKEPTLSFSKWEKDNRCTYKGEQVKTGADNRSELDELLAS